MKRKFEETNEDMEKKSRLDGSFSVLCKRKHVFELPRAKRYHKYNIVEEKDRYIRKLEDIIKGMMSKVQELEYQLEISRSMCDNNIHNNNLIHSF
jgi:hypothetical protein